MGVPVPMSWPSPPQGTHSPSSSCFRTPQLPEAETLESAEARGRRCARRFGTSATTPWCTAARGSSSFMPCREVGKETGMSRFLAAVTRRAIRLLLEAERRMCKWLGVRKPYFSAADTGCTPKSASVGPEGGRGLFEKALARCKFRTTPRVCAHAMTTIGAEGFKIPGTVNTGVCLDGVSLLPDFTTDCFTWKNLPPPPNSPSPESWIQAWPLLWPAERPYRMWTK